MARCSVVLLAVVGVLFVSSANGQASFTNLVFSDNFTEFDLDTWQHTLTMPWKGFGHYTNNRSNTYVLDNVLHIKPTLTADAIGEEVMLNGGTMDLWGTTPANRCTGNARSGCFLQSDGTSILYPIQSAQVRTVESFNFKYGQLEVNAKLPTGDWLWPAIWLLPQRNAYGDWPASGEIDLVESRGNNASYAAGGNNKFDSTLHWGPTWAFDQYRMTTQQYTLPQGTLSDEFHTYGLFWNETHLFTYIDHITQVVLDVQFTEPFWQKGGFNPARTNPWAGRSDAAPFDQKFYLIFNIAVGGTNGYFPDYMGGKPWLNWNGNPRLDFWNGKNQWYPGWEAAELKDQLSMQIDWVKVWQ